MGLLRITRENAKRLRKLLRIADRLELMAGESNSSSNNRPGAVYTRLRTFKLNSDLSAGGSATVKWMVPNSAGTGMEDGGTTGTVHSHLGISGKSGDVGEAKGAGNSWWVIQLNTECPSNPTL